MQQMLKDYVAIGIDNPVLELFSETNVDKGGELDQFQLDQINAIVTGREPIDAVADLVSGWRERGGDQIREEYQAALATS